MGDTTKNLSLYKTDMTTDGNDYFDFDRDLNENWDKIDTAIGDLNGNSANIDLSNLSDEGINKLEAQKMYETGNVLTDEQGYNQLVNMASSTFDSSKLTIVGEPTITEDGIVDNFSNSNYLEYTGDFAFNSCESFEIVFPAFNVASYDTGATASQSICSFRNSNIDDNYTPIRLYETWNGKICNVTLYDNEQNRLGVLTISESTTEGTILYVKIAWDGSTYSSYSSLDGLEWTKTASIESTTPLADSDSLRFGYIVDTTYPRSYIDLKPFNVVINGIPVLALNNTGTDTVEIDGESVVIPYTLSSTGSKIVDVAYRETVQALYEQEGKALYYTIDRDNQNFTLPMGEVYGMMKSYIDENTSAIQTNVDTLQNTVKSDYLPLSGGTMTGTLTLDSEEIGSGVEQIKNLSDGGYADITFVADNENRVATIRVNNNDGYNSILIGAHDESNNAPVGLTVTNTDGTVTITGVTPASSDSSTKIATTAFVKSVLSGSGYGMATYSKSSKGYIKFANGIIIQWGNYYTTSSATQLTLTLPTAFTTTR